ncbi:MAG: dihydrodipicolinate reductase [Calditrichaeota bacterium]|nr:dihydrodipicolinate reductase [Calditrichota bacterium]
MASQMLRVVQFGLGPIGQASARLAIKRPNMELVGAIDIDPEKVGKDVGELVGEKAIGVRISDDAKKVLAETKPDIVLHTTQSFIPVVFPQFETILSAGVNVVSSTEELLLPSLKHPDLAEKLDQLARENGATILGTGVNPGYVLDTLVLVATGVCEDVTRVRAERVVDASERRLPLQKKVGAGMTPEEFQKLVDAGKLGHIGMKESVALVAKGLNWELSDIQEEIEPMIADDTYTTPFLTVPKGMVAGIHNVGRGFVNGNELITLDLKMYVGAKNPHDGVILESVPPIHLEITNGTMGDIATVAMLHNMAPIVVNADPGLKTMIDLPIPRAFL